MNLKIYHSVLQGSLQAIQSKSYAHRIALLDFFAGNDNIEDRFVHPSEDIRATLNCIRALREGEKVLDCGESGSTLRFLLPVVGVLGGEYTFVCHGRLAQRPNDELYRVMTEHGVSIEVGERISVKGHLTAGEYRLRGDVSSQYITGLLLSLPYLEEDSVLRLTTPLSSAPYVDITLELLKQYGIDVRQEGLSYLIKGGNRYSGSAKVEGDWSNAAFFLVAAAMGGDVTITGLNAKSAQGDRKIVDILRSAGAKVEVTADAVHVSSAPLTAIDVDAEDCPDLVPVTAVLCGVARGRSVIRNVQRLRLKESDRVQTTLETLCAFGIDCSASENTIEIIGGSPIVGKCDSCHDHRIAMAATILASHVAGDGYSILTDAEAVNKSYPRFFADLATLGGKTEQLFNDDQQSVYVGKKLSVTVFGASHGAKIGVVAEGLEGLMYDADSIQAFVDRRRAQRASYSTTRCETDIVHVTKGVDESGRIVGEFAAEIYNTDRRSADYQAVRRIPRPSHADYCGWVKYGDGFDYRGGGKFSGRLTAPICIVGGICKDRLAELGINVYAYITSIGNITAKGYRDTDPYVPTVSSVDPLFALADESARESMMNAIAEARKRGDSLGGTIECVITGMPVGSGEYMFDAIEGKIAQLAFAVPAVKGIEFGFGFDMSAMYGSEANDPLRYADGKVVTETNHNGGINGGIANGMPITFRVAVKPTPSIALEQRTVDLVKGENTTLTIGGRHDACIVPRAVPVIEAIAAMAIYDII